MATPANKHKPEIVEEVLAFSRQGYSRNEIAKKMSEKHIRLFTKNSITGIMHRYNKVKSNAPTDTHNGN